MKQPHIPSIPRAGLSTIALALVAGCAVRGPRVTQHGGMREVLREGRSQPRIALAEVLARPHAYAVGAMAGLDGEVTIVNGSALVARVREGELDVGPPRPGDQATLLTLTSVERWRDVVLATASAEAEFDSAIESAAMAAGIHLGNPFPFVVEGDFAALDLHVINGECPMAGGSDPAGSSAPYRLRLDGPTRGTLIGFYASGREGEMTHHGMRTHAHAVLEHAGRTITGHVESVSIGAGARVRVPSAR